MELPIWARHLGEEKYGAWLRGWRHFHYKLPDIETAEDAAALIMIALSEETPEVWPASGPISLFNDGKSIEPIAALLQYRADVAVGGMEKVVCDYIKPEYGNILQPMWLAHVLRTETYWSKRTLETISLWLERMSAADLFDPYKLQTRIRLCQAVDRFLKDRWDENTGKNDLIFMPDTELSPLQIELRDLLAKQGEIFLHIAPDTQLWACLYFLNQCAPDEQIRRNASRLREVFTQLVKDDRMLWWQPQEVWQKDPVTLSALILEERKAHYPRLIPGGPLVPLT